MRLWLTLIVSFLVNVFAHSVYAQENQFIERQDFIWYQMQAFGALAPDYEYMLELQTRYNQSPEGLNVAIVRPAIIYRYDEDISLWLGYAMFADIPERPIDSAEYENRIWQQLYMPVIERERYSIYSRTRIEQRQSTIDTQWAFRYRQRYTLNFLKLLPSSIYIPYISNEIFLNFNNPKWVGKRFVDQNRLYVGIELPLNRSTVVDLRYLYQVQFGIPDNKNNHIFYFKLTLDLNAPSPYLGRN